MHTSTRYRIRFTRNIIFGVGHGLLGYVAMVAIYNKALTTDRILAHNQEALGPIVSYDVKAPDSIAAGASFRVEVLARDHTGKTVKTDNTTEVTVSSEEAIVFDADEDGNYGT